MSSKQPASEPNPSGVVFHRVVAAGRSPAAAVAICRSALGAIGLIVLASSSGCQMFQKPGQEPLAIEAAPLRGSESAEAYQRIREAKSQNAIVLQVAGDSSPVRVLPLPPDGQSVFISDLLKQTGVQDKLGRVSATLYRPTAETPSGIKMVVKFSPQSGAIRPETDYALQPGDRLRVAKLEQSTFAGVFDQLLPRNAARAFRGY